MPTAQATPSDTSPRPGRTCGKLITVERLSKGQRTQPKTHSVWLTKMGVLDAGKYNQDESIAQLVFYESRNGKLTAAVYIWPRDYLRIRASDGRTAASEVWLFSEIEGYVFYVKQATSAEKNLYSVLEADCPLPLIPFGKESDTPLVVDVWTFTIENDGNIAGVSNFQHYE